SANRSSDSHVYTCRNAERRSSRNRADCQSQKRGRGCILSAGLRASPLHACAGPEILRQLSRCGGFVSGSFPECLSRASKVQGGLIVSYLVASDHGEFIFKPQTKERTDSVRRRHRWPRLCDSRIGSRG